LRGDHAQIGKSGARWRFILIPLFASGECGKWTANVKSAPLKRNAIWLNRHRALGLWLSMIFFGKPLRTFPDHALAPAGRNGATEIF
jgi:hypothetical protein